MKSAIITHEALDGIKMRFCLRCGLHVNEEGSIDLDYYHARFYVQYMSLPAKDRCTHQSKHDSKEELLKDLDVKVHSITPELYDLLKRIINKLP